jgi:hypothetical protein
MVLAKSLYTQFVNEAVEIGKHSLPDAPLVHAYKVYGAIFLLRHPIL